MTNPSRRSARALSGLLLAVLAVPAALAAWASPLLDTTLSRPGEGDGAARAQVAALPSPAEARSTEGEVVAPTTGADVLLLQNELARLVRTGAGRFGSWGVLAVSLERGDTLFAMNQDTSLAPASNQKLFSSAAALHHLGPDFRFPTFLLARGEIEDGTLDGDLILYGTGDPALSDRLLTSAIEPFEEFARDLRARGIHTIRGDVLGDGTYFQGPTRHPSWNPRDLNDWFAAPVGALSFNENMVTLQITPGTPGAPPRIRTQPERAELSLENRAVTVARSSRSSLIVVRDDPDAAIELRGEMGTSAAAVWRRLTVSDPAAYAASILRRVLEEEGIRVEGTSRSVADQSESRVSSRTWIAPAILDEGASPRVLAVHYSPPLARLLEVVNKESHNLFSESLFLAMGRIRTGEGSFQGGSRVLADYLVGVVGIEPDGLRVEDGSGLSRLNRATPAAFIRLMAHMDRAEHAEVFWASLPEAGNRRELRRMSGSSAAGNLRAKTGTIHRVSALSGIVRSSANEPILFSIIANGVPSPSAAKRVEDRIGIQLASFFRVLDPSGDPALELEPVRAGGPASATAQERQQDQR